MSMTWTSPWTAYEALKLLGAGGYGQVYLARHVATDHIVALKALPLATSDPASARREIEIAAHVRHPNLVQIYEAKFTVSYLLLATEQLGEDSRVFETRNRCDPVGCVAVNGVDIVVKILLEWNDVLVIVDDDLALDRVGFGGHAIAHFCAVVDSDFNVARMVHAFPT
ncbi:hypothetical protein SDRG_00304 [Saprolegnia diclina VS20]|uniref:Protein kinase domain-containing protein n=1 Tax=Saprolegnia diclina (strain VS20) TaxID=1156394 RepID=T0QWH5_SAPDV|nr:hypothetical protein SDRG_00304 [Saprolegnia diclina VS20]EQC42574.1 hypothetical protein SDRG_00304 [Saprolegnia diclina VS20]|eukprot:XP_008603997.1 hypothetical protein SDRG_00304 [Saprolegnia diclina VS20]